MCTRRMNGAVVAVAIGRGLRLVTGADWMVSVTVSVSTGLEPTSFKLD